MVVTPGASELGKRRKLPAAADLLKIAAPETQTNCVVKVRLLSAAASLRFESAATAPVHLRSWCTLRYFCV